MLPLQRKGNPGCKEKNACVAFPFFFDGIHSEAKHNTKTKPGTGFDGKKRMVGAPRQQRQGNRGADSLTKQWANVYNECFLFTQVGASNTEN
jgi:hypothetical protein